MDEYPDLAACLGALFPTSTRIFVSPDISASSESNPYLRRLYANLSVQQVVSLKAFDVWKPGFSQLIEEPVWHQHWLQCSSLPTLLRCVTRLSATALYRALGGRVLWTVHNLEPHVQRYLPINRQLAAAMRKLTNFYHVHSRAAADELRRAWKVPAKQIVVIPHPTYSVQRVSSERSREQLRKHYGLDLRAKHVFLVFGMIARYKQTVETMRAFDGCDPRDVQLVVAGAVRENEADYRLEVRNAIGHGPVTVCDQFIPDDHLAWFFGAADIVLFNYRQILTSGAIQLARDFGKPVWIPALPALACVYGDDVVRFESTAELRALVQQLSSPAHANGRH